MNSSVRRGGIAALMSGLRNAAQWRLLLWWLLALWLPTLLVALPVWSALQSAWGESPQAAAIAAGKNLPLFADAIVGLDEKLGGINIAALFAFAVTALLSPWLAGMVVASIRAGRKLRMGELLHGGFAEYGRMFRTLLWSVLPLAVAIGVGMAAIHLGTRHEDKAILASEVENGRMAGLIVLAILFVIAHMTVEAGRGWFGADGGLRSAIKAWWRGTKLVFRRPLASLIVYLGTSLFGYVLAALVALWRLNVNGAGMGGFLLGVVLAQSAIVFLAWGRIARLYGFADLAGAVSAAPAVANGAPATTNTDAFLSMQQSEPANP